LRDLVARKRHPQARGLHSVAFQQDIHPEENMPMSALPRSEVVDTNELPADISELAAILGALPTEQRNRIEPILARVIDSTKRRRRILSLVQDALSQLRLDMKYLVFDLEATRRERDEYRERLKQHGDSGETETFRDDEDFNAEE
jgi:hypothetical protein